MKFFKKAFKYVGFLFFIACLFYFLTVLNEHRTEVFEISVNPKNLYSIMLGVFIYLCQFGVASLAWGTILNAMNEKHSLGKLSVIYSVSQFAKYIPGNVAHHLGRIALGGKLGIGLVAGSVSIVVEMLWVIAVAGIFALSSSQFHSLMMSIGLNVNFSWLLLVCALPLFIFGPQISTIIIRRLELHGESFKFEVLTLFKCLLLYAVMFYLFGIILFALSLSIATGTTASVHFLTSCFALAWVAGLLTPGSPGGIGTREVTLIFLLTPVFGPEISISLSIAMRIVTIFGDISAFLLGTFFLNKLKMA